MLRRLTPNERQQPWVTSCAQYEVFWLAEKGRRLLPGTGAPWQEEWRQEACLPTILESSQPVKGQFVTQVATKPTLKFKYFDKSPAPPVGAGWGCWEESVPLSAAHCHVLNLCGERERASVVCYAMVPYGGQVFSRVTPSTARALHC